MSINEIGGGGAQERHRIGEIREDQALQRDFARRAETVLAFLSSDDEVTRAKGAEDGVRLVQDMVDKGGMNRVDAEEWLRSKIEEAGKDKKNEINRQAA